MIIKRVTEENEILGIRDLQNRNLKQNLAKEEVEHEGFVTAEYSIPLLKIMNEEEPSVIAKEGDKVIGYALVVTKAIYGRHVLLDNLVNVVNRQTYTGISLEDENYAISGQLCVAKSHRGQGIVDRMYQFFRQQLSGRYKYLVTDVDDQNPRSLKAHIKSGFEKIGTLEYGGSRWHILLWDWNKVS
jgi:ribosomal protein S18 acetylase RimI-like enzyme